MKKLQLLTAFGAGYVLGARAGRERYDQIKSMAVTVMDDPRVKNTTAQATDLAKEKAPVVKDAVVSAAGAAAAKVSSGGSGSSDDLEDKLHPDSVALQDDPYPRGDLP